MKRTFTFLYSFFLLFSQANAEVTTQDCDKHANEIMIIMKNKANLNDKQSNLLNDIIIKSCITNIVKANNKENDDWFTEKILSGDTSKKEGNKRLKKLK